jgi:hypothetical protein
METSEFQSYRLHIESGFFSFSKKPQLKDDFTVQQLTFLRNEKILG